MVYGYCRISTAKQNIERQERNILKAYPDAAIYREVFTGTKFQGRKELDKIIRKVVEGDTIVFDSVSRMSRNAEEGFELYESLYGRGVNLVFLKEHHIDTLTYRSAVERQIDISFSTGKASVDNYMNGSIKLLNDFLMELAKEQIRLAFDQAQKEVDDLRQRTIEGIETAHRHGKRSGHAPGTKIITKKSIEAKQVIRKHNKAFGGTLTDADTMTLAGVSHATYYRYKRQLLEEMYQ